MEHYADPSGLPQSDVTLCVFPHLPDFLVLDARAPLPSVQTLSATDVFGEAFYRRLDARLSETGRDTGRFPVLHFMSMASRTDDVVRRTALEAILDHVGVDAAVAPAPQVAVLLMVGETLTLSSTQLACLVKQSLGDSVEFRLVTECVELLERLVAREQAMVRAEERREVRSVLNGGGGFVSLWERDE